MAENETRFQDKFVSSGGTGLSTYRIRISNKGIGNNRF